MEHSEGLSVQEASDQLGINEARVRALIKAGGLDANKIGGRWLVDPASVRRRLSASPGRGRPWKPEHVWDRLLALEGDPDHKVLSLVASDRPRSLKPWREAQRLLDLVEKESPSGLLARVRNRAEVRRVRAHPGIIKKILDDPRIVLSGASASAHHDLGLSAENEVDGYVRSSDLPKFQRRYRLERSKRPNVLLRVVKGHWPFEKGQEVAPKIVVAIDLLDSDDERLHHAGQQLLERLVSRWHLQ